MIYLMSPYTHDDPVVMAERLEWAARTVAWYREQGATCVSPVVHCHYVAKVAGLPEDWATWKQWCHDMLHVCEQTTVLCLPGWDRSRGVAAEIELARICGKPILHLAPERVP